MPTDPVCGMAVEASGDSLSLVRDNRTYYFCSESCREAFAAPSENRQRLARLLLVGWPLALAAALFTYAPSVPDGIYVAAASATVVQFYVGRGFYRGAADALRGRIGNMDLLIATGTSAAYLYSLAALLLPGRLPAEYFFDASSLIVALILTGNYLEQRTRERASSALARLAELIPATALRWSGSAFEEAPTDDVRVHDIVRVLPGQRFPIDGTVREGRSEVDESLLTGEPFPVPKEPGSRVISGSVNGPGALDVATDAVGPDRFVAQVSELLSEVESARVPLRRLAERIAAGFVPFVLALGVAAALGWYLLGGASGTIALLVFVSVVIIACPCAFGLATPAAILVGTGRAAEEGILFRGADSIERTARTDLVVTDKTGTLTEATPELAAIATADPADEAAALALAAGLESGSEHALARAVVRAAHERGIAPIHVTNARATPGVGVSGEHDGRSVAIVAAGEPDRSGAPWIARAEEAASGRTRSVLRVNGEARAILSFETRLAPGVREGIAELRALGIEVEMVTGDREDSARAFARRVGIERVVAGARPEEKLRYVRQRQADGRHVGYVGDGINDAAALGQADTGFALGTGSEVAQEAGNVLLVRPAFTGVPRAIALARRTVGRVRANLLWAIGYNAILLPIAAGALVPLFGFSVYSVLPVAGAVAMALSSTSVLLNSLSLRWTALPASRRATGTDLPARR